MGSMSLVRGRPSPGSPSGRQSSSGLKKACTCRIFPPLVRKRLTPWIRMRLPVGDDPPKAPPCVASMVKRAAMPSPSETVSFTVNLRSGKPSYQRRANAR